MGAMEEPLTAAAPAPIPPEDAALARDLLSRGMSPDEVASITAEAVVAAAKERL